MANTFYNQKMYDLAARNSILLESVKLYEFQQRADAFRKLRSDLKALVTSVEYKDMSYMSRKEVATLIKKIKKINASFYDVNSQAVLDMFDSFTRGAVQSAKRTWVTIYLDDDYTTETEEVQDERINDYVADDSRNAVLFPLIWLSNPAKFAAALREEPISGMGKSIEEILEKYNGLSEERLESIIQTAWVSGYTREDVLKSLIGDEKQKQGTKGATGTMQAQLNTIIDTALGYSYVRAQELVTSRVVGKKYIWISVMDDKTSSICRERNRKVYTVGTGPLPPAHPNCRSSTAPYNDKNGEVKDRSLEGWIKSQDEKVQTEIKKHGIINSSGGYKATKPLTQNEFFNKPQDY